MPDPRQYKSLAQNDRNSRRKVVDAIAVLRKHAGFVDSDRAKMRVARLRLPSGEAVGFTELLFEAPWDDQGYSVVLRTAAKFRGRRREKTHYDEFDIIRLNDAEVDFDGAVKLADGIELYAVELSTAPMLTDPSPLDWRIVHTALRVIEGGDRAYRSLRDGAPPAWAELVPDEQAIDCAKLAGLTPPPLKEIVRQIKSLDPKLDASEQKIADALRKFGIRVPTPRPRRRGRGDRNKAAARRAKPV